MKEYTILLRVHLDNLSFIIDWRLRLEFIRFIRFELFIQIIDLRITNNDISKILTFQSNYRKIEFVN